MAFFVAFLSVLGGLGGLGEGTISAPARVGNDLPGQRILETKLTCGAFPFRGAVCLLFGEKCVQLVDSGAVSFSSARIRSAPGLFEESILR
jgi:hypothetical protein